MHTLFRLILVNYLSLYLISNFLLPGFTIKNGVIGLIKVTLAVSFIYPLFKPLFKIIFFPLNVLTLGLFNFVINMIIFYLVSIITPELGITGQSLQAFNYANIHTDPVYLNRFSVMFLASLLHSVLSKLFMWMLKN